MGKTKIVAIGLILGALILGVWKWLQGPEDYLRKKTQKIIAMTSFKGSDLAVLAQVSKIDKFIHFNVQMTAEYEGQIYQARSLNEFRSLLTSYFQQKSQGDLDYKNLQVQVEEGRKKALVNFDGFFKRDAKTVFCKIFLDWIKEKKWYIKQIEVSDCQIVKV